MIVLLKQFGFYELLGKKIHRINVCFKKCT